MRVFFGFQLLVLIFISCTTNQAPQPSKTIPVATIGDSVFTLDRLNQYLSALPDTLSQEAIERFLLDWVEAQAFAQEAANQGLYDDPLILEKLSMIKLRFLRGLLEGKTMDADIEISQRQLKKWYRANKKRFQLSNRQLKFAWYTSADSSALDGIHRAVKSGKLRADQLSKEGVYHGKTGFVSKYDLDSRWVNDIFNLEYLEVSPVYRGRDRWIFYHAVGQRPVGYQLSLDNAEGEIRQDMEENLIREKQIELREKVLRDLEYKIDLDPLYLLETPQ
jgi:hypothetical protein